MGEKLDYEMYLGLYWNMSRVHAMQVGVPVLYGISSVFTGVPIFPIADALSEDEELAHIAVKRFEILKNESDKSK